MTPANDHRCPVYAKEDVSIDVLMTEFRIHRKHHYIPKMASAAGFEPANT